MAFPDIQEINCAKELREINFGTHEGLHFDNLPTSEKKRFADPDFQAIGGSRGQTSEKGQPSILQDSKDSISSSLTVVL